MHSILRLTLCLILAGTTTLHQADAAAEFSAAKKLGTVKTAIMDCGDGFWDPRKGGECWSCDGAERTVFPVTSKKACRTPIMRLESPATRLQSNLATCPDGSFFDPRNGGECWRCAPGTRRSLFAVDGAKACSKAVPRVKRKATYSHNTGSLLKACKKGTFANVGSTRCYRCPQGYRHDPARKVGTTGVCYKPGYTSYSSASFAQAHGGIRCKQGFFDPIDRGSCWSCPGGYRRSLTSVKSQDACFRKIPAAYGKATFIGKKAMTLSSLKSGVANSGCRSHGNAAFFDLVDGGSCWSCPPSHPVRTVYPVTRGKACATNACGARGERPCYAWERFPSCHGGLVENPLKNQCVPAGKLACNATVKTIAGFHQVVRKANNAGKTVQDKALQKVPGAQAMLRFIETQNAQLQKQASAVMARMDFSRVTQPFEQVIRERQALLKQMQRSAKALQRSQRELERLLTDAALLCAGNGEAIDKRLKSLGLVADLGQSDATGLAVRWLPIANAHAATSRHAMAVDIHVEIPYQGADWTIGLQYVTDFNGQNGLYLLHGGSTGIAGDDSPLEASLGKVGLTLGWEYDNGNNRCASPNYQWGMGRNVFGPLGIGMNCGGFGGLSLSLDGNINSTRFMTPAGGLGSMPPALQLEKPTASVGIGIEGALRLW